MMGVAATLAGGVTSRNAAGSGDGANGSTKTGVEGAASSMPTLFAAPGRWVKQFIANLRLAV
jgi:hypothetical protein